MERGERGVAVTVLGIAGIVGVLATVALFQSPTGLVAQGEPVYPTISVRGLPVICSTPDALYLGNEGSYAVYCCREDLIGQNECNFPQKVLLQ